MLAAIVHGDTKSRMKQSLNYQKKKKTANIALYVQQQKIAIPNSILTTRYTDSYAWGSKGYEGYKMVGKRIRLIDIAVGLGLKARGVGIRASVAPALPPAVLGLLKL